jgi:Methane oxygenase PmoA
MMRILVIVFAGLATLAIAMRPTGGVRIIVLEDQQRVDVLIDDALFTAYMYHDSIATLKKPVLYPIRTAGGQDITRGYPFERRAGERVDHPHHIGHWLNYGDVNGYDFWNNSDAVPEERRRQMGVIRHRAVVEAQGGDKHGVLEVEADWMTPSETPLLLERTRFVFSGDANSRLIDRITTLTALSEPVSFTDNKEGMVAIRVTRALEHPEGKPILLTDPAGRPRSEAVMDDAGVTGSYLSSEGLRGVDVWGTRAEWMMLSGVLAGESVTVAIIDHPLNPGYPTYWHARGYGLFAANPLGQKALSGGKDELNFALKAGESVTFRYRIAILSDPADAKGDVRRLTTTFAETP